MISPTLRRTTPNAPTIAGQGIAACRQLIARETKSAAGALLSGDEPRPARAHGTARRAASSSRKWNVNSKRRRIWTNNLISPGRSATSACFIAMPPAGRPASAASAKRTTFLEQAAKLAPDYPENHLNLVESYLKWNERDHAKQELNTLDSLWPKARTQFHRRAMGAKLG